MKVQDYGWTISGYCNKESQYYGGRHRLALNDNNFLGLTGSVGVFLHGRCHLSLYVYKDNSVSITSRLHEVEKLNFPIEELTTAKIKAICKNAGSIP